MRASKPRNSKGQFINVLSDDEKKKRASDNTKKWRLKNKDRVKEIQKKSRSRPEYKKRAAELKRKRYYEGKDNESIKRYQESDKGKLAAKRAKKKWADSNPEKIIRKDRRMRDELKDSYVIQKIRRDTHLTADQIRNHPEIIEAKKIIIKIKRL